ncbi:AraC family transcriptional regulator [Litchfieldella anticariensis]|nr:AraC family transcriptional regulator [Halomonas anticariensis]
MDTLAEILRAMRLSGGVFLDAEFTEPWCIRSQVEPEDCHQFMRMPPRLIAYHYVVEGRLTLSLDGQPPMEAHEKQLLVLPRNDAHLLGSTLNAAPADAGALIEPAGEDGLGRIRFGGGGTRTRILCGFLGSENSNDPLVASLPPIVKLDLHDRLTGPWIEGSMRYAASEVTSGGEGASANLARLAELLFAEAIREYLKALPPQQMGWLAGLRDPYVARALALMHGHPGQPWTLDELAQHAGLSRSAFSEHFVRLVRVSPVRYLTRQRLQRAADRLRQSGVPISRIADEAGYESEASFTRAFKREFGTAPGAFRRQQGHV